MKRFVLFLTLLLFAGFQLLQAQAVEISGTITSSEDGTPVPGASVIVKGTTIGTVTSSEGEYVLRVPEDATELVVSFVGLKTQDIRIEGRTTIDIVMEPDVLGLDEVVVTALGITRERKALGYSVQDVGGEDLVEARDPNVVNSLQGKLAGVQISAAQGTVGAGSRILIRGMSSLSGNNQPLFVVDGVPIMNSLSALGTYGGQDYGNAAADINPNDVEKITVLKGASAAALYGSRASNGVVLITTKTGKDKRGLGVVFEHNQMWDTPLVWADVQDKYGQGYNGQFEYGDGNGAGINDNVDESWGPPLDGRLLPQFDSPYDPITGVRTPTPWVAHPDNIKDLIELGYSATTNLSLAGSSDRGSARLSLSRQDQKGVYPNTDQRKYNVSVNTSANITDKLKLDATAMYVKLDNNNIPGSGYATLNPLYTYQMWGGRQVDTKALKERWGESDLIYPDRHFNWNHSYHDNPYWTLHKNLNQRDRDRIIGTVALQYFFTDWLNLRARVGNDYYGQEIIEKRAKGSHDWPEGQFNTWGYLRNELNADLLLSMNKQFGDISLDASVGSNLKKYYSRVQTTTVNELIVPDLYSVSNAQVTPTTALSYAQDEIQSVFGMATIGFKNWIYLDITGRNDWSSTLPEGNNSYFYPSVSLGWIVSDMLGLQSNTLSFAKLRASWAQLGAPAGRYRLAATYGAADPFEGNPRLSLANRIPALDLKPELTTTMEFGADIRFFMNRLGLDVTYYNSSTTDQILDIAVSSTTGFSTKTINAGEVKNSGIEIMASGAPVRTGDFSWDVNVNFTKNKNEVISLAEDMAFLNLYYSSWGTYVQARPGELYGNIYGRDAAREFREVNEESGLATYSGRYLVNPAYGGYVSTGESVVLGNIVPDYIWSLRNSLRYKNAHLSILIDGRQGSDVYSVTKMFGMYAGMLEETVENNDKGNQMRDDPADGGGWRIEGVYGAIGADGNPVYLDADGNVTDTPVENTIYLDAQTYGEEYYGRPGLSTFDASFIKLREVIIGYRFDQAFLQRMRIQSVDLSLVGRNLALLYSNVPHIDPEIGFSAGRVQGMESTQLPSLRSMGFNVRFTF